MLIKSTKFTRYASIGLLVLYVLYALASIGMTGLLFSAAIGLLSYGVTEAYELTTILVILSGVLYKLILGKRFEGFQATDSESIVNKVALMKGEKKSESNDVTALGGNPSGVLSSPFAEGFADAGTITQSGDDPSGQEQFFDGNGKDTMIEGGSGEEILLNKGSSTKVAPSSATSAPAILPPESFKNKNSGLFKLGEIPTDEKGGFHIDQGTTVLNALNALKPDQIKAMSQDTQQLIDTQKSLMGMLGTMKPMLQDGRQLLDSFNTMFKN